VANGLAGLACLAAWRVPAVRGRWIWVLTALAQVALMTQVTMGVVLVSNKEEKYVAPGIHMFYGFVGFATIAIAYSARDQMKGRLEMLYAIVGLFLMGLGIRAVLQVR
jgi:hypothetical protein